MATTPDYVVLRAASDLPDGFMPPYLDGRWLDRAEMREGHCFTPPAFGQSVGPRAVAVPAGRFEVREDGAVAEVWEFRV